MIPTKRPIDHAWRRAVGLRVFARRQYLGLTIDEASFRSGLARSFFYKIERGMTGFTVDSLVAIAEALGVPPAWFFEEIA